MRLASLGALLLWMAMLAAGTWALFKLIEPGSLVQLLEQNYLCADVQISVHGRVA